MSNGPNGTLYVGVTSSLLHRVFQHQNGSLEGFTKKYVLKRLVYFELHGSMPEAIAREKQLKGMSRDKKLALIRKSNPAWRDLYPSII